MLVFGQPDVGPDEIAEVSDSLQRRWLGTGPKVAQFEREFAAYKNAPHAVALHSCTAALHLSAVVAGLGPGDEVVTTPLTFCATANAILHTGAIPILADVDPFTGNIDPAEVERRITPRTRAILPVHLAGRPCAVATLVAIARRHGLTLIEDCAHAVEAEVGGQPVGTFGDFGCFSFYATKNLATGEGGMLLARRPEDAGRAKTLALHGLSADAWQRFGDAGYRHYEVVDLGFKYNMMDLQAAIGIHQLRRLETNWLRRDALRLRYDEAFAELPAERPAPPEPGTRHALHLYTLRIDPARAGIGRDTFIRRMTDQGIGVGVHYRSLPEHPYYRERLGWRPESVPHAARFGRQTVSLPFSPALAEPDIERVIRAVRDTLLRPRTR
jgi:dTDP-4-amino-4,6-dideoxygalactose transaminase